MKRAFCRLMCVFLMLLYSVQLTGCSGMYYREEYTALKNSRPDYAEQFPDFDGEITDVRVTVIPREYSPADARGSSAQKQFSGFEFLQICYGYQKDGVWYDIPCENYELVTIFNPIDWETKELRIDYGYEAAGKNHIVRIGPYLLVSISEYWSGTERNEWTVNF